MFVTAGFFVTGCMGQPPIKDFPPSQALSATLPLPVKTLQIQPQTLPQQLELSGTIQSIEQAVLATRVMGQITHLTLEAGDRVQKGQVVAEVNVADLIAQTAQAQSGVAQAQAELARTQATVNQLQSHRIEAEAALKLAEIDQKRMFDLHREGAVSQAQLDQATTTLEQTQARVEQAEAGIRQAQAAILQAQAAVAQAQAGVTLSSVNASYGSILAPFDGVVTEKLAYEGEIAAPGMPLLKLENPHRLHLMISVPESNLHYIKLGQAVQVRVDAADQTLTGTIQQIVPASDPQSRSFLIKIPLQNSSTLISGMFGRVEIPIITSESIITIPTTALIQRGQLQGVYVVEKQAETSMSYAVLRWIKTGKALQDEVQVIAGLTVGDRIITKPVDQLTDGQPINPEP
jgi:multidrug efflux pump subunit AcrA (membrane-fusion protein)